MGTMFLVGCFLLAIIVLTVVVIILARKVNFMQKIIKSLRNKLFYNSVLRFCI